MEKAFINGKTIAFDRFGHGKPLLMIHGFPLDHHSWDGIKVHLADKFDLILPDLPGFGDSDIGKDEASTAQIAQDLAALLDHLKVQKAFVAGHSMGGYVALALAQQQPGKIFGLGMISSQVLPDSDERKKARLASAEKVSTEGVGVLLDMAEKLSADPRLVPYFRDMILRQKPAGVIAGLKAMAARPDATPFFSKFKFPVVLVHGNDDSLIPPARTLEMKEMLSHAEVILLDKVGHSPMIEQPEKTAAALLKFLD